MKTIFTFLCTLLFITIINTAHAQCDFPEGDFEIWEDVTSAFNDDLPNGTIILPLNGSPLIRLFTFILIDGFLDGIFGMISDASLYNSAVLGIERSEDASSGQYALKMGGDSIAPTSDLLIFATCGESPDSLFFDAKHFGQTTDSISLFCFVGNTSDIPINENGSVSQTNVNKFVAVNFTAFGDSPSFQTLAIDFTSVNASVAPDTIVFWLILDNQEPMDGSNYGYIIVDNFRFAREKSTTPTTDIIFVDNTSIYPNLASDYVNINSDKGKIKGIQVFDLAGRIIHTDNTINSENYQINVSDFPNGQYIMRIVTDHGFSTERFFKAN
jgi:hypothetical protein